MARFGRRNAGYEGNERLSLEQDRGLDVSQRHTAHWRAEGAFSSFAHCLLLRSRAVGRQSFCVGAVGLTRTLFAGMPT